MHPELFFIFVSKNLYLCVQVFNIKFSIKSMGTQTEFTCAQTKSADLQTKNACAHASSALRSRKKCLRANKITLRAKFDYLARPQKMFARQLHQPCAPAKSVCAQA